MFEALEGAYRQRDYYIIEIQYLPFFDPYRADPRFQALLTENEPGVDVGERLDCLVGIHERAPTRSASSTSAFLIFVWI